MKRCAIYARYSTDQQNDRSIEDQIAVCQSYAARNGLVIVAVYSDAAQSGATMHGRPGIRQALADAKARRFDVLLAELLSRIGRDEEDRAAIRKRLTFADVAIMTPTDGVVTRLTDGIKAIVDGQQLEDIKIMTRRGMAGAVREGRHAGGRAYGYRAVAGRPGVLAIVPDQAEIVRRIFDDYLAGKTPRAIAGALNRAGVPAPRGKFWNASTINGMAARGGGILNNQLYAGRIVWNKNRMALDPDTGRRVIRSNPRDQWQTADAPALAIVAPETFDAAQRRRAARAKGHPVYARAPKHLLSGLLRCAGCGAGMAAFGSDRSGRRRIRCTGVTERGTCDARRSHYLDAIESLVLDTLRAELREPRVVAEYVRTYHAERRRLAAEAGKTRAKLERRLGAIAREVERAVDGICQGVGDAIALGARTKQLAAERADIERTLAALPETVAAVALHPAVLARYEAQIATLQQSFAAGDTATTEAIRGLIDRVIVGVDRATGRLRIEIVGRLRALLGDKAFPNATVVCTKVVAGARFELATSGL